MLTGSLTRRVAVADFTKKFLPRARDHNFVCPMRVTRTAPGKNQLVPDERAKWLWSKRAWDDVIA